MARSGLRGHGDTNVRVGVSHRGGTAHGQGLRESALQRGGVDALEHLQATGGIAGAHRRQRLHRSYVVARALGQGQRGSGVGRRSALVTARLEALGPQTQRLGTP
jgi:hypothetical protein